MNPMKFEFQKKIVVPLSVLAITVSSELDTSDVKKTRRRCFLGQRHIVALIGFFSSFLIQSNRLALGVGIAAMVKHRHANETPEWNSRETSCPLSSLPSKATAISNFEEEFDWTTELKGYVLGAGFLGYIVTQTPAGRLADSIGSKPLLVFSNALSGILVVISPFAARWHVYALIAAQFLRGASQGITSPVIFKMLSNWVPKTERGTLNGIAMCGYPAGIAIGGLVTGWLCGVSWLGWPSAFYVWGTITVVVAILIHFIYYDYPEDNPWITDEELKYITDGLETKVSEKSPFTPWKRIFTSIPSYAYFYGLLGHYWGIAYFLTVHPTFMGTVLHYSIGENGLVSCLPALLTALSGVLSSMASHWMSKKNLMDLNMLRKITTSVSAFGYSLCMVGILLAGCDASINILCFTLSLFFKGIGLAGIVIVGVDMAPVFAGSITGVASTIAAIGSFLVPVFTGLLTTHETLSEWQNVFWLNFGVVGSSGLVFLLCGSADVQPWNYPDDVCPIKATNEIRRHEDKNCNRSLESKENLETSGTESI